MDAPATHCTFCGKIYRDRHHLTGRGPDHTYLDYALTVSVCHRCHVLAHDRLRAEEVDEPPTGTWTSTARLSYEIRRVAVFFAQLAERSDNPVWHFLAATAQRWADEIERIDIDLHPDRELT